MNGSQQQARKQIVVALTGASGSVYALRLLQALLAAAVDVHLTISPSARLVYRQELGIDVDLSKFHSDQLPLDKSGPSWSKLSPATAEILSRPPVVPAGKSLIYHRHDDLMSAIASGSFLTAGMVICPCSGSTLGAIVHGTGENLIHRAASVHLKERRKLVLVPRETPLSTIQLENMRRAAEAGAVVLPAMPGFYHGVSSIGDLVDFVVARILDQLGIEHRLMKRWGEE
jgi:4-hydroxy-3-polyprenylbenzoate decarboxylase